jgi:DNA mismatch repair ATPase MutS
VLVITGANASGKSTFLRASLLSVVLARCGVTIPAEELRLRRMRLATVMAVQDDVMRGISRFQAEVGRLKQVLDLAGSQGLPVLVALDEPLSGTNSVERHLGTAAVARALAQRAAGVLISTHDLALAELAQEKGLSVQVVHFSDHAAETGDGGTLAFDYVMRPGVLQTTNALRIMRLAGLPVPDQSQPVIHQS